MSSPSFRCFVVFAMLAFATTGFSAPRDRRELQQAVGEVAAKSQLRVGVALKDLTNGDEVLINPDTVFPQGSSIRIHLLAELFRQAAAGKVSLDELRPVPESARVGGYGVLRYMGQHAPVSLSLRDYAVLVATINDNVAANLLTDIVGMDKVNAALVAQGTPEIKFQRRAVNRREVAPGTPENVGTPRAVLKSLELLYRGKLVNRATSDAVLELLGLPDISYVRRDLPLGVRFAGQSGSGPNFRCDEGIVLLPKHPYVFCVMIDGIPEQRVRGRRDYSQADQIIAELARLALDYFQDDEFRGGSE